MGAHRQAFRYPLCAAAPIGPHAATVLSGICWRDRHHSLPGPCCLVGEDSTELPPARIADALREVMVPYQGADLQIFELDRVVGCEQIQRRLVQTIPTLALDLLMRAP